MRKLLLTVLLAAGLGLLFGSAEPAFADGKAIIIMPPTLNTGSSPYLTTGYHSSPSALDWDDSPSNTKVFIRTFGVANYSSPTNIALAVGTDRTEDNPCYTTLVTFYEAGTWVIEGKIKWFHALPRWENINMVIHGDDTWAHLDAKHMSDTTTSDTCAFGGPHVHETFEMVDGRNTGLYPSEATCDWPDVTEDCDYFQNNDIANWTMSVTW